MYNRYGNSGWGSSPTASSSSSSSRSLRSMRGAPSLPQQQPQQQQQDHRRYQFPQQPQQQQQHYDFPLTPLTPGSSETTTTIRSTRSTTRKFTSQHLQQDDEPHPRQLPHHSHTTTAHTKGGVEHHLYNHTHFMQDNSPNKFLPSNSPDKNSAQFLVPSLTLQEAMAMPPSFEDIEDDDDEELNFSGLADQLDLFGDNLDTPRNSPLEDTPPCSNESGLHEDVTRIRDAMMDVDDDEGDDEEEEVVTARKKGKFQEEVVERRSGRKNGKKVASSPGKGGGGEMVPRGTLEMDVMMGIVNPGSPWQDIDWSPMQDGVIKELYVKNFLCHGEGVWKFSPHLNIIIGLNGSGKSAMITAIMVACGAKANTTGRADSLHNMIKYHEKSALVGIVLKNGKGKNKQRDVHIRKTITKSSTESKVRFGDKPWTSTKSKDLASLMTRFEIYVNSPVQVLTQTVATTFLQNSDPSSLFKKFKDITLITQFEEYLIVACSNVVDAKETLNRKKVSHTESLTLITRTKTELEKLNQHKLHCSNLRREKAWAIVKINETSTSELQEKVSLSESEIKQVETEKSTLENSRQKMIDFNEEEKSNLSKLRKEASEYEKHYETAHEGVREVSKENQSLGKKIKLLMDGKSKIQKDLKEVERIAREIERGEVDNNERVLRETTTQHTQHTATLTSAQTHLAQLREKKSQIELTLNSAKESEEEMQENHKILTSRLKEKTNYLKTAEKAEVSKLDKFGKEMKTLVDRISKMRWHSSVAPIGPIGAHFTVKKEFKDYTVVIEKALQSVIHTFVTDSGKDVIALNRLVKEVFGKGVVRVKIAHVSNLHRTGEWWRKYLAVVPGYPTIFDALDIQNPAVVSCLIENAHITGILLFKDETEACPLFKNRNPHQNCKSGVSLDFLRFFPFPDYSVRPLPLESKRPTARFLQTTTSTSETLHSTLQQEIQSIDQEASLLSESLKLSKRNLNALQRELSDCDKRIKQKNDELNHCKASIRRCEQVLEDLNKKNTTNDDESGDFYEEQKGVLEQSLKQRQEELDREVGFKNVSDIKLKESEKEAKKWKQQLDEVRRRIQDCDDENGLFQKKCAAVDKKIKATSTLTQSHKTTRKRLLKELEVASKELESKTKAAQKQGDRLDSSKTPDEIQSELEGRENFYKENLAKLTELKLNERSLKFMEEMATEVGKQIEGVQEILNALEPLVKMQTQNVEETKAKLLLGFEAQYRLFVMTRNYTGEMLYDTEDEKLFYYVAKDETNAAAARAAYNRDPVTRKINWKGLKNHTDGLSGGEKSFATFAFFSAIREHLGCPFFMLDEADVFMDAGNKRASMDMIVEQVRTYRTKQFFLFTPDEPEGLNEDELNDAEGGSFIKIIRLTHTGRRRPVRPYPEESPPSQQQQQQQLAITNGEDPPSKRRR